MIDTILKAVQLKKSDFNICIKLNNKKLKIRAFSPCWWLYVVICYGIVLSGLYGLLVLMLAMF